MSRKKIEKIQEKIQELQNLKSVLEPILLNPEPMIRGAFYYVYRTCTHPNCCCQKGKKHGPFPALSYSIQGKRGAKTVRQNDAEQVQKKASAYKIYQQAMTQWRKINRQLELLLEKLKREFLEEYH